jgi:predicted transcriptional regulator
MAGLAPELQRIQPVRLPIAVMDTEVVCMGRPAAKELTERELEVMHVFWDRGDSTAAEVREQLAAAGRDLAYTTVATLVRILGEKGFLEPTNTERPFVYRPVRDFDEVSRNMVGDLVQRVFHGSREQLLFHLVEERKLTARERATLKAILREDAS